MCFLCLSESINSSYSHQINVVQHKYKENYMKNTQNTNPLKFFLSCST